MTSDDDLDFALALSLSEAQGKRKQEVIEQEKSDEALARALQRQFDSPDHIPENNNHRNHQSLASQPPEHTYCAGCNAPLISPKPPNTGLFGFSTQTTIQYFQALGRYWHPQCFVCTACKRPLQGQFTLDDHNRPYHSDCHRQKFHPTCRVCSNFLPVQENRIVWSVTPYWNDKTCSSHTDDGTQKCASCTRYKPMHSPPWKTLVDGRAICSFCSTTAVADTAACQPLYENILSFYGSMGMTLPARPPLMLVDNDALNAATAREDQQRGSARREGPIFHTRGLCLTEYSQRHSVVHTSRLFGLAPREERVFLGPKECQVTAILVLHGFPYLLTGCIIAHECMHAWLRLKGGFEDLPVEIEEGLCQLMALLWLENGKQQRGDPVDGASGNKEKNSGARNGEDDQSEERFSAYLGYQIRSDPSIVYGDGLRAALGAFQRLGLPSLLAHVQKAKRFP